MLFALEKTLVCVTSSTKPASDAVTNVFCSATLQRLSMTESWHCHNALAVVLHQPDSVLIIVASARKKMIDASQTRPVLLSLQQHSKEMQNTSTSGIRNIGQFHRVQWKDAANFNGSSIKAQQSTVAITGVNMATLKSSNLATNECYVFVLEPFVNSKACDFLPTFEVIREAVTKFSDIVANGIASFNSSWEEGSEASLARPPSDDEA
ncbi:hypothetical protein B0H13DRAFT_1897710 [Mycena leptocephala]|nr:hypothetical protein B0H13DRAFT_1897710 [Mycena leptocephala]